MHCYDDRLMHILNLYRSHFTKRNQIVNAKWHTMKQKPAVFLKKAKQHVLRRRQKMPITRSTSIYKSDY